MAWNYHEKAREGKPGSQSREWQDRISACEPPPSETPNTNAQGPAKFQISNTKTPKTEAGANVAQVDLLSACLFGQMPLKVSP